MWTGGNIDAVVVARGATPVLAGSTSADRFVRDGEGTLAVELDVFTEEEAYKDTGGDEVLAVSLAGISPDAIVVAAGETLVADRGIPPEVGATALSCVGTVAVSSSPINGYCGAAKDTGR